VRIGSSTTLEHLQRLEIVRSKELLPLLLELATLFDGLNSEHGSSGNESSNQRSTGINSIASPSVLDEDGIWSRNGALDHISNRC
jgi:hypothetical protein